MDITAHGRPGILPRSENVSEHLYAASMNQRRAGHPAGSGLHVQAEPSRGAVGEAIPASPAPPQ